MLPNTYYKLDYIQSTGTQYINTGVSCGNFANYKMTVDIATATSDYGDSYNFTMMYVNSVRWVAIVPTSSTAYKLQLGASGTQKSFTVDSVLNRHVITLDSVNSKGIVDNEEQELANSTGNINGNICFFTSNNNGSYGGNHSKTKLYKAEIYSSGTLIREFIPAMRKSDSVVGLYDLVNDAFYTNAGSGTFTYGSILYHVLATANPDGSGTFTGTGEYASGTDVTLTANPNSGFKFVNWKLNGYTKLEYIESTGTQYINCELESSKDMKFEIDCMSVGSGFSDNALIGISNNSSSGYRVEVSRESNNKWIVYAEGSSSSLASVTPDDTRVTITYEQTSSNIQTLKLGEETASLSKTTGTNSYVYLCMYYGGSRYYGKHRIYSAKIWKDNVLVRNFIPVIRNSDSQFGLFDLIGMKFYANAGSGEFINYDLDTSNLAVYGTQNKWFQATYDKPVFLKRYSGNNASDGAYSRAWTMTLKGSNDGTNWTDIQSDDFPATDSKTVDVTCDTPYQYYRWYFSGYNNTYQNGRCIFDKIVIVGGWDESPVFPQNIQMIDNPLSFNISDSLEFTANFDRSANCRIKVNGTWKYGMMYLKTNNEWKLGNVKIKQGTWKGA